MDVLRPKSLPTVSESYAGERIPPQNLEAEMALLGALLIDRELMPVVSELVNSTDFYSHIHEAIFSTIAHLYEKGEPVDKISLVEELRTRGQLERIGGPAYLSSLTESIATASSAEYYARIIREKSLLRGLIHAGSQVANLGFEGEDDVESALDKSEQLVYDVGRRQSRGDFTPITKLLRSTFEQIDKLSQQTGERTGITSGFPDIDSYTSGLHPGNFIILAARPAMGKTSMALNMAAAAAKEDGKPVAIFSLEMTNDELVSRLLCAEARVDAQAMRKGNLRPDDWEKISYAMGVLAETPIFIDDTGTVTVSEIRSRCRRLQAAEGLGAVYIDYLQLVRPSAATKNMNRNEELSDICRVLKATAKELKIPIIALAQLNRGVEQRQDKRPMLSDLRDSGAIEQEADMVTFLYRDAYYNPESPDGDMTEFIIAKQRSGPTGMIKLRFLKEHTLFVPFGEASHFGGSPE
jgi:replicative DNA helicase